MGLQYALTLYAADQCDPKTLGEVAALAESSGWDAVFLEDFITHWCGNESYDPWVSLAVMATRTSRIRIGTTVTALPRRRPWKVAREALSIDHLSNGRMILGVGLGAPHDQDNFDKLGEATDLRTRAELLDESLDILVGLWRGEPFSYNGKHYQLDNVQFKPKPVQQPRIPIWIGGGWPGKPIRRAVKFDGFLPFKSPMESEESLTADDVREVMKYVREYHPNPDGFSFAQGGMAARSDNAEVDKAHIRKLVAAGVNWWTEFIDPYQYETRERLFELVARGPLRID